MWASITTCHVVCRPTQAEAEDYYELYASTMADQASVDHYMGQKEKFANSHEADAYRLHRKRFAGGAGTYPLIGTPQHIAEEMVRMSEVGLCRDHDLLRQFQGRASLLPGECAPAPSKSRAAGRVRRTRMNIVDSSLLDEGDPAFDQRAFRRALGQFATGVTVITTKAGNELVAVTANSFSSVSLDPPMVLWSLRKESRNLAAFQQADRFAINILAADQIDLSSHFSRSTTDKFASCAWQEGIGGVPLLDGAAAQFECRRVAQYEGGDHVIFLGQVEYFRCFDRVGLLFAQGRYALALDHPGTPADLPIQVTRASPGRLFPSAAGA